MHYVLGIYFSSDLRQVLLINKTKPEWQKGRYNFPGGKTEKGEHPAEAASREFREETGLKVDPTHWRHAGRMRGSDWTVEVLVAKALGSHGEAKTLTEETVMWFAVGALPIKRLRNVEWLMELALEFATPKLGSENLGFFDMTYGA